MNKDIVQQEEIVDINNEPLIIVYEGGDYTGKSFMCQYTKEFLHELYPNKKIVIFREPGGTEQGEKIRNIIMEHDLNDYTNILLFTASRSESYEKIVKPLIEENAIIIMDRSLLSTFVYQNRIAEVIKCSLPLLNQFYLLGTTKIMCLLNADNELINFRKEQIGVQNKLDLMDQEEIRKKYKKALFAIEKMNNFPLYNTAAILNMTKDTEKNKAKIKDYILEQIDRMKRGEL